MKKKRKEGRKEVPGKRGRKRINSAIMQPADHTSIPTAGSS
jgi:hypothetical protein